ncbi:Mu transposase domain-containing protein [Streptomyces sp. NPDC088178]|uniref:Mu transposase domain-containing protein n=1 Tax=Streptomyces sp. NPDC088178 TaxID=3365836 RepID=UPI00380CAC9F
MPTEDFECGVTLPPKVDRSSRITVPQCRYSVPTRFIGQQVRVLLQGNELLVFERRKVVARHPRLTERCEYRDALDYLEIRPAKPGALQVPPRRQPRGPRAPSPPSTRHSGSPPGLPMGCCGNTGLDRGPAPAPPPTQGGHADRDRRGGEGRVSEPGCCGHRGRRGGNGSPRPGAAPGGRGRTAAPGGTGCPGNPSRSLGVPAVPLTGSRNGVERIPRDTRHPHRAQVNRRGRTAGRRRPSREHSGTAGGRRARAAGTSQLPLFHRPGQAVAASPGARTHIQGGQVRCSQACHNLTAHRTTSASEA